MRMMAITSAVFLIIMFMGVSLSSRDKPVSVQASSVGTVMAMPTVTPSPTATVAPVVKATVHVYCAGEVEMCQTGWCAEMCRERVYTESHHGLQY